MRDPAPECGSPAPSGRRCDLRLNRDVVEAADLIEHRREDLSTTRFATVAARCKIRRYSTSARSPCSDQRVVRAPERDRGIEVFPISVSRKRARLAHQPADHMAVVDVVLLFLRSRGIVCTTWSR